jgi:hypothetical protein
MHQNGLESALSSPLLLLGRIAFFEFVTAAAFSTCAVIV